MGEQLKMLLYVNYALVVGFHSVDATGMEAADTTDQAGGAIGFATIEHATWIVLKVWANLELA